MKYSGINGGALCAALLATLVTLGASVAQADTPLTGVQTRVDEDFAWVLLLSPDPLPEPTFRMGRGEVRAWLHGVEHHRMNTQGDGMALRDVRIRTGAGESTLVHIRLGDDRRLEEADFSVVGFEGGLALRIRRAALPMAPPEEVAFPLAGLEGADSEGTDADAEASAEGESTEGTSDEDGTAAVGEGAEATADGENEEGAEGSIFETETEAAIAGPRESTGTPVGLLLFITVLLAALLGVVKFIAKRRVLPTPDDIDVVSSKRIGPRHQLIVVRALGEEHLLSVNGGQTQLITSVSSDGMSALESLKLPAMPAAATPVAQTKAAAPSRAERLGLGRATTGEVADEERFGARLLALATGRTDSASLNRDVSATLSNNLRSGELRPNESQRPNEPLRPNESRPSESSTSNASAGDASSVAGLLELKRRLG